nr:MAG TPA: hypothetical protein [Caudoviricetes sp.]
MFSKIRLTYITCRMSLSEMRQGKGGCPIRTHEK